MKGAWGLNFEDFIFKGMKEYMENVNHLYVNSLN